MKISSSLSKLFLSTKVSKLKVKVEVIEGGFWVKVTEVVSTKGGFCYFPGLPFPSNSQCRLGALSRDKIRPQIELALPVVNQKHLHDHPIIINHIGREASGENHRRYRVMLHNMDLEWNLRLHERLSQIVGLFVFVSFFG